MKKLICFLLVILANINGVWAAYPLEGIQQEILMWSKNQIKTDEKGKPYNGIEKEKFDGGEAEIPYKNGLVNGMEVVRYDDGTKIEAMLENGLLEGEIRIFYPSGKLKTDCKFAKGECITSERTYYEDGSLYLERDCMAGEFTGYLKIYYPNGNLDVMYTIIGGIPSGVSKHYDEDGNLLSEVNYVDGMRQGIAKVYYPDGKLKSELTYVNNIENGPIKEYYENGVLRKIYTFKDGKPEGEAKEYYRSGRLYSTAVFKDEVTHNLKFYYDEPDEKVVLWAIGLISFALAFAFSYFIVVKKLEKTDIGGKMENQNSEKLSDKIAAYGWSGFYWLIVLYWFILVMGNPYLSYNSAAMTTVPYLIGEVLGEMAVVFIVPYVLVWILRLLVWGVKKIIKMLRNTEQAADEKIVKQKKLPKWIGALLFVAGYALLMNANLMAADGELADIETLQENSVIDINSESMQ